jgi:hypothetical protein
MSDTESPADDSTDFETTDHDTAAEIFDLQRHRINGDETGIVITPFADGWQVLAIEVAHDGHLLDVEAIGDAEDRETAVGMAKYWQQQNPDGILGASDDGGGVMASLNNLFGGGAS